MGHEWNEMRTEYGLTNGQLCDFFNVSVLDDAIRSGWQIFFSHDPRVSPPGALADEWAYLRSNGYMTLEVTAGGWIARR